LHFQSVLTSRGRMAVQYWHCSRFVARRARGRFPAETPLRRQPMGPGHDGRHRCDTRRYVALRQLHTGAARGGRRPSRGASRGVIQRPPGQAGTITSQRLRSWTALRGAVRRAEDRAQLRLGQGDHPSVAALEGFNDIPPGSRSPIRQLSLRTRSVTGGAAPEECVVLQDAARGRGGRSVHDADSHLPVMWRQLVRLPDGVAARGAEVP
jgi:hypothetical protein